MHDSVPVDPQDLSEISDTDAATTDETATSMIAELETRQDDVIYQLDDLNARIENLIELYNRIRVISSDDSPGEAIKEAA